MDVMELFFWFLIVAIGYTWGGYLLLLKVTAVFYRFEVRQGGCPTVSVLIGVYNEEGNIEKRIKNILASNYPAEKVEVVVASDGSTDGTHDIVRRMGNADPRIRLVVGNRGGKSAAQNSAVAECCGDVIVLTDADTEYRFDTIQKLVELFGDSRVGCTSGRLEFRRAGNAISESQGMYWKYEMALRRAESGVGLLHTASGPIMAVRKSAWVPFPPEFGDDCVIPLNVMGRGLHVLHVEDAVGYDAMPSSMEGELRARSRMTLRNFSCTCDRLRKGLFKRPAHALAVVSHKLMRWLTPYFMVGLFILSLFLAKQPLYLLAFLLQAAFYGLALTGYAAEKRGCRLPLAGAAFSFLWANIGFLVGVYRAMLNERITSYNNVQ